MKLSALRASAQELDSDHQKVITEMEEARKKLTELQEKVDGLMRSLT